MNLSTKAIKEIAGELDCGMVCYLNLDTYEFKSIIDPEDPYSEEEYWKEDLDEIENNWANYEKIDKMPSSEAFQIMEDFADQVSNEGIKNQLIYALNNKKPFKNFKYKVDNSGDVRDEWFKFKELKYQEWKKKYLNFIIADHK